MIKKYYKSWKRRTKKAFIKKFPLSLINILLILIITYTMTGIVAGFGNIAFLGYLAYSILNLDKLIKHPYKSFLWAAIYIVCALIIDILLSRALPMLEKGTGASIFSGLVLTTILIYLWIKIRKLK